MDITHRSYANIIPIKWLIASILRIFGFEGFYKRKLPLWGKWWLFTFFYLLIFKFLSFDVFFWFFIFLFGCVRLCTRDEPGPIWASACRAKERLARDSNRNRSCWCRLRIVVFPGHVILPAKVVLSRCAGAIILDGT